MNKEIQKKKFFLFFLSLSSVPLSLSPSLPLSLSLTLSLSLSLSLNCLRLVTINTDFNNYCYLSCLIFRSVINVLNRITSGNGNQQEQQYLFIHPSV